MALKQGIDKIDYEIARKWDVALNMFSKHTVCPKGSSKLRSLGIPGGPRWGLHAFTAGPRFNPGPRELRSYKPVMVWPKRIKGRSQNKQKPSVPRHELYKNKYSGVDKCRAKCLAVRAALLQQKLRWFSFLLNTFMFLAFEWWVYIHSSHNKKKKSFLIHFLFIQNGVGSHNLKNIIAPTTRFHFLLLQL